MTSFPVAYDVETNTIKLDGSGGASVMLSFLLKAKFGEAFDPEALFHPELARLITQLKARSLMPSGRAEGPFNPHELFGIAGKIVDESWRSGWWEMSPEERVAFLQDVVAAPYVLSPQQIDEILEGVDTSLYWRRRIVQAADKAGETSTD